MATSKKQRKQYAKSELLMHLAMHTATWAQQVTDHDDRTKPFAEWAHDDPLRKIADTYDLTGDDLAKILTQLGDELENRAERAGYADAWWD